ncbi:GIY-YIG endonuclease [Tuber indicum]|nr:GIY-YIG endonuclease [Tuber indicum]
MYKYIWIMFILIVLIRSYSTSSRSSDIPLPIKVLSKLNDKNFIDSCHSLLRNKGGIYSFFNTVNNKQYIGSAKDLYLRFNEHLSGKKSNIALQRAIEKHSLDKFNFYIYEYFSYESKLISDIALIDLETSYIQKFDFETLYNFKKTATSLEGYKHTEEAKLKMARELISKPGKLNPMYGKKHSESTKAKMSTKKNKYPLGVSIYDLDYNLVKKFNNNVELAEFLNISKTTVGKYLNSGKIYNNIYHFKVNT